MWAGLVSADLTTMACLRWRRWRRLRCRYDADGGGTLDRAEVVAMLSAEGLAEDDGYVDGMIDAFDAVRERCMPHGRHWSPPGSTAWPFLAVLAVSGRMAG